jgi:exodeoxyribonuclease V alpha subunit
VPTLAEILAAAKAKQTLPTPPVAPAPTPAPTPAQTSSEILMAKLREANVARAQVGRAGDVLFGTGLTRKVAESAERKAKKANEEATKTAAAVVALKGAPSFLQSITARATADAKGEITMPASAPAVLNVPVIPARTFMPTQTDIVLDPSQVAALEGLRLQKYGCLIGPAGCGKTTVTKALVRELEATTPTINIRTARADYDRSEEVEAEYNVAIAFASFTGRAVEQMKRALPKEYHPMCSTIHRLLGYAPTFEEKYDAKGVWRSVKVFRPSFTAFRKLPYKVIVIDEAGMCPIPLWNELMEAVTEDCRIILIGDINQLPPVQGRSVLGFAMLKWPTFELTKIHRQAEGDPIITNAHKILKGFLPARTQKKFDIADLPGGSLAAFQRSCDLIKALTRSGDFDPAVDAIIVPQNKGTLGQWHYNETLMDFFNPKRTENGIVVNPRVNIQTGISTVLYAVGDKVMLLQNDNELNLTNGMIGFVRNITPNSQYQGKGTDSISSFDMADMSHFEMDDIDAESLAETAGVEIEKEEKGETERQASHTMTVEFPGGVEVLFSTAGAYRKVTHSYVFTCHKSQGGEYPTVVIIMHTANRRMLWREWLYTAVTRARTRVIILCNGPALSGAIALQKIKGATVQDKARSFLELQSKEDTKLPTLPDPTTV